MRTVCAWCKKNMKDNEEYASEGCVTHGICSQCFIRVTTAEQPRSAVEILNYVQEPIFEIDSCGIVKSASQSGLEMVDKNQRK